MPMSPQDAAEAKAAGWSDEEIANAIPAPTQQMTNPQAIAANLKGNAGGIIGGGAGGIGGGMLVGGLAGSEVPVIGNILGMIAGGLAGAYGGQKIQHGLQSDATNQAQALALQQAQQQHPITSSATDIIASSLAGGGKPSLSGIKSLLSGSLENGGREALQQAALNPAIQTGVSLASGNGIPSIGELAGSALGGAAFSKTWLPHANEPAQEVNNSGKINVPKEAAVPQDVTPPAEEQDINKGTLEHGDEVHAILPSGEEVHGWVNSVDEAGNPILWTDDGKKTVLPEANLSKQEQEDLQKSIIQGEQPKVQEQNANQITSPVETVRSETPGSTTPVAEGESSGVQQAPQNSETKAQGLPTKEQITTLDDSQLQKGYDELNNSARSSMAKGDFQNGVDQATAAQWHREEMEKRQSNKVTPETSLPPTGSFFQNAIDKVRKISAPVADAYHKFFNERQLFHGQVYGSVKDTMAKTGFTNKDGNQLMKAMMYEEKNGQSIPEDFLKNDAQKAVWSKWKEVYKQQGEGRLSDKQPVIDASTGKPRLPVLNELSHPVMANPKIIDILRANTDTKQVLKLKNDFIDDQISRGVDPAKAQENLAAVLSSIQGKPVSHGQSGNLNFFSANRRAQGIPLPESWSRTNFEQNLRAFSWRNAADRAHFRNIESNDEVMHQLNETHTPWGMPLKPSNSPVIAGNKDLDALISSSQGEKGSAGEHIEKGLSAAVTSGFIASPALSGVHIPIANIVGTIGLADNPITAGRMILNAIRGVNEGITTARKNGLRVDAGSASTMWDANLNAAERLHGVANLIRKVSTFNELATKGTVGFTQAAMETLVPSKLLKANAGNVTAQQWLRHLDPEYYKGKQYTPDQLSQLASFAVNTIHGSSDARTLPAWMLHDNELSGFMSLAHWSISQTDRFMKDIYTPATRGDIKPLLTTMFGAAIGGYMIKKLREDISGKKSSIPSLSEIASSSQGLSGNVPLVAYNMIAALQYSGFAGMFSQIAKYPFDAIYKNSPQGATFPLDETVSDIGDTIYHVTSAIANDPNINWVDLAQAVGTHLVTNSFRLGREAYNQAIDNGIVDGLPAQKKQLSDKMGQLRRFDMTEGLPYNEIDQGSNPYMNIEQKKFKMDQDIGDAVKQIPALVTNIIQTYSDKPDVMLQKLKALKTNDYATFPSMENTPVSFMKYVAFLNKEEGPEKASQALQDYLIHRTINEVKSSVVP